MKPARSLRQWALIVTGIGAGVALAMILLLVTADIFNMGVPIFPPLIFLAGCALVAGGLVTLLVDGVLRLTGRRF